MAKQTIRTETEAVLKVLEVALSKTEEVEASWKEHMNQDTFGGSGSNKLG